MIRVAEPRSGRRGIRAMAGALLVLAAAPSAGQEGEASPVAAPAGVTLRTEVFEVVAEPDAAGRVERLLVPALDLVAGDELRYVIRLRNAGDEVVEAGRIQVQTVVPPATRLLPGSAGGAGALVEYALSGGTFSDNQPELAAVESAGMTPVAEPDGQAEVGGAAPPAAPLDGESRAPPPAEPEAAAVGSVEERDVAGAAADAQSVVHPDAEATILDTAIPDTAIPDTATPSAPGDAQLIVRWTYQKALEPGAEAEVFFHVRLE